MKTLKFILSLLILFQGQFVQAKIIALGASKNINDFKEYLVENPSYVSLNDYLLNQKLLKGDSILNDKYKTAVKGLALEDLKPSIFLFQEITDFPSQSLLFSDEKIKLISESYFRLSNLDRSNTDFWISKAIYFNPDYTPSKVTFNPTIIQKFNKESSKLSSYFYKLKTENINPKYSRAFVNGLEVNGSLSIHPSTSYNLQIFMNGKRPLTKTLRGDELIKLKKPQLNDYSLGNCKNPKFHDEKINISADAVFYSKNCIKLKKDQILLAGEVPKSEFVNSEFSSPVATKNVKNRKKNIFSKKKTWYYILGGVALSSLALSLSQSSGSKVRPVQHD